MRRLAVLALAGVLITGCGQTGALFLPGERPAEERGPATDSPPDDTATTEEDDEEAAAG